MAQGDSLFPDSESKSRSESTGRGKGRNTPTGNGSSSTNQESDFNLSVPSGSLPKSRDTIRDIDEKYTPNRFASSASFSVPVYVSPVAQVFDRNRRCTIVQVQVVARLV